MLMEKHGPVMSVPVFRSNQLLFNITALFLKSTLVYMSNKS